MAEEGLKIKIGADVQQAVTSLNTLNASLNKTTQTAANVGTAGMNQLTKGTSQASTVLTNFSRVASDAPFGLIGIANNIDPLVQSFIQLRKSTNSGKEALGALVASLTGGGGLVLAVSLITSALQFAAVGLDRWKGSTKEANEETKKAKDELDKYTEAQKNSVRNLTQQRLEIDGLVSAAKNLNLSEKDRIAAINKLNEIIPDNIGFLNAQNIATQQGDAILKQYIKTIEARATAELLAGRIAENNVKLFENRNKVLVETEKLKQNILTLERDAFVRNSGSVRLQKEADFATENIRRSQEQILKLQNDGRNAAANILSENEKLRAEYLRLIPTVNTLNENTNTSQTNTKNNVNELTDLLKNYNEQLKGINWDEQNRGIDGNKKRLELAGETLKTLYLKGVKETSSAWIQVKSDFDKFQTAYDQLLRDQRLKQINEDVKNYVSNIGSYSENVLGKSQKNTVKALQEAGKVFLNNYKLQQKNLEDLRKKNLELANTITGYLSPALEGVFESLVKGEDPFETLKNSVQQLIIELGKAVIKSLILKAVTSAIGGPAAGQAAGAGLGFIRGDQLRGLTFGR
jgi:hypothetical protein